MSLSVPPAEGAVFFNCPWDEAYRELMNAVILTIVAAGFFPRIATDTGDVARARIERIHTTIDECHYSIHDLSRCKGEGALNHARFNMPLELGMAIAKQRLARSPDKHDWCILVPSGEDYAQFVSDLAGFDLKEHDGTTQDVIRVTMSWLATRQNQGTSFEPPDVIECLPAFTAARERLVLSWGREVPWVHLVNAARSTLGAV
jgi:hypothetical protein